MAEKETGAVVNPVVVPNVMAEVFPLLSFQEFLPFSGIRVPAEKGENVQTGLELALMAAQCLVDLIVGNEIPPRGIKTFSGGECQGDSL